MIRDELGPLNRFVVLYGDDLRSQLREATTLAMRGERYAQPDPDLDADYFIEGSVQYGRDRIRFRFALCKTDSVLRAWALTINRSDDPEIAMTYADSVVDGTNLYVGNLLQRKIRT